MSKISEKQRSKRTNILDAAYDLFINKSFSSTSIDDVVKKAGIAKGTFYLYFKDKYDLMDRIVIYKSLAVFNNALKSLDNNKSKSEMTFVQQMLFLVESIVDYMQQNKELLTLLDKKLSSSISAFSSLADDETKAAIADLIAENEKNGFTKEETIKRIYIIVDMIGSVCCDAIIHESPFKLDEIKPLLLSTVEKILI